MRPLHVLDMSLPHVAGYTSRARSILENQRAVGFQPVALTGVRQPAAPLARGAGSGGDDRDDGEIGVRPGHADRIGGIDYFRTPRPAYFERTQAAPVVRELVEMGLLLERTTSVARNERADVVHAHSPVLCGIPALFAARRLGLPSVYEVRALWEDAAVNLGRDREGSARYAVIRRLETALANRVDALVVICDGLRRDFEARGVDPARLFTVPNGVDADRFQPLARDEALARELGFEGKRVVGYIGTFFRFEGLDLMLRALDRITRRDDSVRGLIVGHGETEGELRALHAKLGLEGRVVIRGRVAPSDVARHYSVTDVLCYPRTRHRITDLTTPLKPLEALCMEKAIVVSDVGGLRELVTPGETALTFAANSAEDLEAKLVRALHDDDLRRALGAAGRRDMLENRSWREVVRRYENVYAAAQERLAARRSRLARSGDGARERDAGDAIELAPTSRTTARTGAEARPV